MNVSFTIISNLIEVERTSKVKIANKLCVLSLSFVRVNIVIFFETGLFVYTSEYVLVNVQSFRFCLSR